MQRHACCLLRGMNLVFPSSTHGFKVHKTLVCRARSLASAGVLTLKRCTEKYTAAFPEEKAKDKPLSCSPPYVSADERRQLLKFWSDRGRARGKSGHSEILPLPWPNGRQKQASLARNSAATCYLRQSQIIHAIHYSLIEALELIVPYSRWKPFFLAFLLLLFPLIRVYMDLHLNPRLHGQISTHDYGTHQCCPI
eukprot:1143338-Pelagomonas_calceolata.AAC.7